ncbi:MAG: DUF924 family protein [Alphaproteobacteria bacterium]|nr:DUF924 family protein [Alphaproteobacteria bacterium]
MQRAERVIAHPQRGASQRASGTPLFARRPATGEREDWLKRYNAPPLPILHEDEDPYSPDYSRTSIDETPGTILHDWFGYAADRPALLKARIGLWFDKSFETDCRIARRFGDIVARLASGEARRWAARGPRERLAAVVALDQFSRNMFRDTPAAFENDALALDLTRGAIAAGEDLDLKPAERWFLYMPLEHSESASDQSRSLEVFRALRDEASAEFRPVFATAHDFAKKHAAVIRRFGRFPHRNAILGRVSTSAERAFLARPGSGF